MPPSLKQCVPLSSCVGAFTANCFCLPGERRTCAPSTLGSAVHSPSTISFETIQSLGGLSRSQSNRPRQENRGTLHSLRLYSSPASELEPSRCFLKLLSMWCGVALNGTPNLRYFLASTFSGCTIATIGVCAAIYAKNNRFSSD